MMEGDMFQIPENMTSHNHNSLGIDGNASNTVPNIYTQPGSYDLNNQNHVVAGLPVLSTMHREVNDFQISLPSSAGAPIVGTDASASASRNMLGRNLVSDNSQEQYAGGTLIPAASLATLLMARNNLQNDPNNIAISRPPPMPVDSSNDGCSNTQSKQSQSTLQCGYYRYAMNTEGDQFHNIPLFAGKSSGMVGSRSSQLRQNTDSEKFSTGHVTADQQNSSFNYCKELSLSLASSLPRVVYGTSVTDRGEDVICSGGGRHSLTSSGFGSEQSYCHSHKELSLGFGAYRTTQSSNVISGSLYLQVVQEILAQIASFSLENLDLSQLSYLPSAAEAGPISQMSSTQPAGRDRRSHELSDVLDRIEVQNDPAGRQAFESKRGHLLALLQAVDDQYNRCLDEIHTVVSAFHAATELDPNIHACFALHAVSSMYKDLRERISKQILAIGALLNGVYSRDEKSPESSCNERQWALQQLKRKDHQLWRPQRGLPERSVAVLRAWMFQNFLHPYPKDSEKHLLAIKSGLTRSQVSNWFINARVRLWKPLIEEMYSELNKRKARQNEGGANSNY